MSAFATCNRHPLALPFLIVLPLVLVGCSHSWGYQTTSMTLDDGSDIYLESISPGFMGVAVQQDGLIRGADGYEEIRSRLGWDTDKEIVDHPRLAEWQRTAAEVETLVVLRSVDTQPVISRLQSLPFDNLVAQRAEQWAAGNPSRAASLLDAAPTLDLTDDAWGRLTEIAVLAPDAADARLVRWAAVEDVLESPAAFQALATAGGAGPATLQTLLQHIDEPRSRDRAALYGAIARRLASDPVQAAFLVRQLDELPSADQANAALTVLADSATAPAFSHEIVRAIDDLPYRDRTEVFLAAAQRVPRTPVGSLLVAQRLRELRRGDRGSVALTLLGSSRAGDLVVPLLGEADELASDDREAFLLAVVKSPWYRSEVPSLLLVTADRGLTRTRRARVLTAVATAPATPPAVAEQARHLLNR